MLPFVINFSVVLIFLTKAEKIIPTKDSKNPLVTFGSCNKFSKNPNPEVFQHITRQNSDVWIWVGDVVYLDSKDIDDEQRTIAAFTRAKMAPFYTELRTKVPVIGTWDDHDFGNNDGNKHFKHKERNKQIYLDFLDEPSDSHLRTRDGVYEAYYLGEEKRIKIILLDVRYNRDSRLSFGQDMLGEKQWAWLEEEIKNIKSDFTLIASGSQILPDDRIFPEHWFGESRERLIALIRKYKRSGVILLSGDVHYAEIMKHPCPERVGYNLYEFTSSGLTHYISEYIPFGGTLFNNLFPQTFNTPFERYIEKNFGVIRFSFEGEEPHVILEARNDHGTKVLERKINYSELVFKEEKINLKGTCVLDKNKYYRLLYKYFAEIFRLNRFMIIYTIVVGLLCIGILTVLVGFWTKRRLLINAIVKMCQKIWKPTPKVKAT